MVVCSERLQILLLFVSPEGLGYLVTEAVNLNVNKQGQVYETPTGGGAWG